MFWIFGTKPRFDEQYPELWQFLAKFEPEFFFLDFDSELEGVQEMVNGEEEYWRVVKQGREVLSLEKFPWQDIVTARKYWFRSSEEARAWLANLIDLVEAQLKHQGQ